MLRVAVKSGALDWIMVDEIYYWQKKSLIGAYWSVPFNVDLARLSHVTRRGGRSPSLSSQFPYRFLRDKLCKPGPESSRRLKIGWQTLPWLYPVRCSVLSSIQLITCKLSDSYDVTKVEFNKVRIKNWYCCSRALEFKFSLHPDR